MKIGEEAPDVHIEVASIACEEESGDTSCGVEEEGQSPRSDNVVKDSKPKSFRL